MIELVGSSIVVSKLIDLQNIDSSPSSGHIFSAALFSRDVCYLVSTDFIPGHVFRFNASDISSVESVPSLKRIHGNTQ